MNVPTIEFYPPKNLTSRAGRASNGLSINSQFLIDTLNANLFPIVFYLPDNQIFIAANTQAMLYDWENDVEYRLPPIPRGVRITYPMTGGALLPPLTPANNYVPEVLICGGSTASDTIPDIQQSSQYPASAQCVRMALDNAGIAAGWQVEEMPYPRVMPDLVLLPNGDVMIVNGAKSGLAGYGNVYNPIGQSNADHPALGALLYRPSAPANQRFSSEGIPASGIPRLYHSTATLLPDGSIMIAGSSPNADVTATRYPT